MDKDGEPLDNNIHKEKGNLDGKNISARKKEEGKAILGLLCLALASLANLL